MNKFTATIAALLIIVSILVPPLSIGENNGFRLDIIAVFGYALPFLVTRGKKALYIPPSYNFLVIACTLAISMYVSNIAGLGYYYSDSTWYKPLVVVLSKIIVFIFFLYLGYYKLLSRKIFLTATSLVFIVALLIGCLQFFNVGGIVDFTIRIYSLSDVQTGNLEEFGRVFSTTGTIIGWSGLCLIVFFFFYFVIENRIVRVLGLLLVLLNIFFAGSRSGILGLVGSFIVIKGYQALILERKFTSILKVIIYLTSLSFMTYYLLSIILSEQMEFIWRRFLRAEEAMTTAGRGEQLEYFFDIMNRDWLNYIFGLGPDAIKASIVGYLEIDPVFIIVSFGIIGFILHYSLIYLLLKITSRFKKSNTPYFLFIMASTIASLIYSLGFFFIHDKYTGLPFWWLSGFLLGHILKDKYKESLLTDNSIIVSRPT